MKVVAAGATSPWNRGTVIIVGQGRAGKSAATDALLGNSFRVEGYESTIGAEHCSRSIKFSEVQRGISWTDSLDDRNVLEKTMALETKKRLHSTYIEAYFTIVKKYSSLRVALSC